MAVKKTKFIFISGGVVSSLGKGIVAFSGNPEFMPAFKDRFTQKDGKWLLPISSGTVQMVDNKVIVLAD